MSRPRKRPRLEIIASTSPEPDVELKAARKQNDELLKARWEDIFARYERDFTGIGDEIGIVSGQIEVDNGHLRSMQDETDAGEDDEENCNFNGKRMLRAMTVAPSDYSGSVSEDEDVFQSIETITDNAMLSEIESEDFIDSQYADMDEQDLSRGARLAHSARAVEQRINAREERSSSPDSLFDGGGNSRQPDLRAQVIQILQEEKEQALERAEEDIEPAWRLPVHISSLISHNLRKTPPARHMRPCRNDEVQKSSYEDMQEDRPKKKKRKTATSSRAKSIQSGSEEARRSQKVVAAERNLRTIRADSEDPLQEGFSSGVERPRAVRRRPRNNALEERQQNERSTRSSSSRRSVHTDASDVGFIGSEEEYNIGSDSDSEETDRDDKEGRNVRVIIEQPRRDRRALIAKYKSKSADSQNARTTPRFSAPETEIDKNTHPWHAPATRVGKPVDFKSAAQRKQLNAKYSFSTVTRDPVSAKLQRDKVLKPMEKGICIYCNNNHTNKNGVGSHWDRVLTNFVAETLNKDDPHDIEFIHEIRRKVERRIRPPVTRLLDFTTMLKMHEGQGMSFEEMSKSNLLFTTKSASQLEKEFRVWRPNIEDRQSQHQWTDAQIEHLRELMKETPQSSRQSRTLIRIHRLVGSKAGMNYPDVGNKIADIVKEAGDFAIRLPMHPSLTHEMVRAESEVRGERPTSSSEDDQPAAKAEDEDVIDPEILQAESLHIDQAAHQASTEYRGEIIDLTQQPNSMSNAAENPDLYQQLSKYANKSDIDVVPGSTSKAIPPIDMAPRY